MIGREKGGCKPAYQSGVHQRLIAEQHHDAGASGASSCTRAKPAFQAFRLSQRSPDCRGRMKDPVSSLFFCQAA